MTYGETAAWASAIATSIAVIVALLKEEIVVLWRKPTLTVRAHLAPPDCHKTDIALSSRETGTVVERWPCYYFRVWVQNSGTVRAEQVQVYVSRLLRKQADGTFREDRQFLPMNLKWSHTGEVFAAGISPKMGKHCDVGHIVIPDKAPLLGHRLAAVPSGKTMLCLDLEVAPNTMTHLLGPGSYRLDLRVAASNSTPTLKTIEVTITGEWFDEETRMFADAVGFREIESTA